MGLCAGVKLSEWLLLAMLVPLQIAGDITLPRMDQLKHVLQHKLKKKTMALQPAY